MRHKTITLARLLVALLVGATVLTGCRRNRVIPDSVLADIFHDAFIANSYVGVERINIDSLQIYEPIFNNYGYTGKDVRYTIGNFSRRKSARLGNVVERAITRLDEEGKLLEQQVVILDTIRNVAIRKARRTIYTDSLVSIRSKADSVRLMVEIEPVYEGEYVISYEYEDEEDIAKYPRRAAMWLEREMGGRHGNYSVRLRKSDKVFRVLNANAECSKLVLDLGRFENKKQQPKQQNLTIRNLQIRFTPTEQVAVDSLFKKYVDIKIFADGFLIQTDSLTLPADSTRVL